MPKKFDFNDILIKPAVISVVKSRKEVNPYYDGYLPLITAPMDTVVSLENKDLFDSLKINLCLPRGIEYDGGFVSYSLDEIKEKLSKFELRPNGKYLIDIANGHMSELVGTIAEIKNTYPNITLMVGNIANPRTYMTLSNAGADYVRVGIGGGSACFVEGSLVKTVDGYKPIQNIEIDDVVLTHNHEYKKVVGTMQYPTSETLININDNISTKNHEYYVLNKKYAELVNDDNIHDYAEWLEADKLNDEYFLISVGS